MHDYVFINKKLTLKRAFFSKYLNHYNSFFLNKN